MATKNITPLKPMPNESVLNAIRNEGSSDYQRRIEPATKGAVQQTLQQLVNNRPSMNEFLDQLVNRIGLVVARNNVWSNPMAIFKRGMLTFGDTIEEIQVGLLKSYGYDPDREELERSIFGTERPEVQANFHKVNRQEYYKITINEPLLHRAFLEPNGLTTFVNQLMQAPTTSDQWDEFLIMCQLFAEYESNGGFFKINVPDVASLESNQDDAKAVLRKLRATADTLTFISTRYNAAHMPVFAHREDLVIFTTPEFKAAVDVEALAAAFNLEHADVYGRIVVIPEAQFGIKGCQAIMTTSDFFVMADQRLENTSAWNPVSLQNNYFLHHWEVISASRFVPAIMFTTGPGDEVIEVSTPVESVSTIQATDRMGETVTDVQRGEIYTMEAHAVTAPADGVNDGVRWSVSNPTTSGTFITPEGVLHIGGQEDAATLTVTATSTWINPDDPRQDPKTATLTLNVTGVKTPNWPNEGDLTGFTVKGVAPTPAFAVDTTTYTVAVEGGTATVGDVDVSGKRATDAKVSVNTAGDKVTVKAFGAKGDPVYTINVTAAV